MLAKRYGVSTETIRKWRKRGPAGLPGPLSPAAHAALEGHARRSAPLSARCAGSTNFALDDLTFVVTHFLPHLNRDSVWRILKAEGLNRRPKPASTQPAKGKGTPSRTTTSASCISTSSTCPSCRPPMASGASAISTSPSTARSRSVHLAVKDDETEQSAIAFLREAAAAFPFRITHVLTDNGSCFTAGLRQGLRRNSAQSTDTPSRYTPQTNGMVERLEPAEFGSEVLGITIWSHPAIRAAAARLQRRLQRPAASACSTAGHPYQVFAERLRKPGAARQREASWSRRRPGITQPPASSPRPPRRSRDPDINGVLKFFPAKALKDRLNGVS